MMAPTNTTPLGFSARRGRKSATPYELIASQSTASASSSSPFRSSAAPASGRSAFGTNTPVRPSALGAGTIFSPASIRSLDAGTGSPFRRNVPFGSPGLRASTATASAGSFPGRSPAARESKRRDSSVGESSPPSKKVKSARFVRRRSWTEKAATLPVELFHSLSMQLSLYMSDLQELGPSFGWILGGILHFLSIMAHVISPDSDFGLGFGSMFSRRRSRNGAAGTIAAKGGSVKSMFVDDRKAPLRTALGLGTSSAPSTAEQMRRLASMQRQAWLRAISIVLSLSLLLLASYNAYYLFVQARRRYTFWMKSQDEPLKSENAKLVPVVQRDDERPSLHERIIENITTFAQAQLRKAPIINWFVPQEHAAWRNGNRNATPMMYALDVWRAPELSLSIFW
ncbi:hypothetical protein K437DRAFT_155414 [Tilletiaria anomala UBC 951]|uniref:Uncharacterized protein n=1 Tax=Tilletiaria anomala (strain ATCC 24038 / CBS 436.72 / UBC 951) TaxID=1037660 RepID=A0A066VNE3_TILAU|nr:uncharacterized protein K437DRAFT_155414 [Tilletiaria anomala UBC 951]KDN42986.1 hypothetical protein K437DRAFT_155414 [Tilletiaria anomala UBC 951]